MISVVADATALCVAAVGPVSTAIGVAADGATIAGVALSPDVTEISVAADATALWVAAGGPVSAAIGVAAGGATIDVADGAMKAGVALSPDVTEISVSADATARWVAAGGPVGAAIGVAAGGATIDVVAVEQVGATNSAAAVDTTYEFTVRGWCLPALHACIARAKLYISFFASVGREM